MREESFLSTKTQEGRKEKREAQICDKRQPLCDSDTEAVFATEKEGAA